MDRHIRWLRRMVIAGVAARLAVEAALVGVAIFFVARIVGADALLGFVACIAGAQLFALGRVTISWFVNPVTYRYLMNWTDTSGSLVSIPSDVGDRAHLLATEEGTLHDSLARKGFAHIARLGRPGSEAVVEVYGSTARLALVTATTDGEPFVILSSLSDGRILVTSHELVPPYEGVVVNQNRRSSFNELVASHVGAIEEIRTTGVHVVESGAEVVREQLRLEWRAWNELGPFIGPWLAVGHRPQPLLLQAHVPEAVVRERTMQAPMAAPTAGSGSHGDEPALRLVDAA